MKDVDFALEQGAHGLCGDLDVPVCANVHDVDQPHAGQQLRYLETVRRPPSMPTTEPCSVTYSGTASGSAATSRRGWPPCRAASTFTSSGRQMPASEQRGHFGLDRSGGGGASLAAVRAWPTISMVRATRSGVISTGTRCLVSA